MGKVIAVLVDGNYYVENDAVEFDKQAGRYDQNAKDQTLYAAQARDLARRIRDAVKAAEPITLAVDSEPGMNVTGRLSNGDHASVAPRFYGNLALRGFYVTRAPEGYEWAMVKDSEDENVLILRKQGTAPANPIAGGLKSTADMRHRGAACDESAKGCAPYPVGRY